MIFEHNFRDAINIGVIMATEAFVAGIAVKYAIKQYIRAEEAEKQLLKMNKIVKKEKELRS